jgi:hypothetical protein
MNLCLDPIKGERTLVLNLIEIYNHRYSSHNYYMLDICLYQTNAGLYGIHRGLG